MNPSTLLIWIVGGIAAILLTVLLFVKLPGDGPADAVAVPLLVPASEFSRKPCMDCEASTIRVAPSENLNRCQVCGCEFLSAD